MLGSSPAIQSEFRPRYSLTWYFSIIFGLFIIAMYIRSKVIGENITRYIDVLAITATIYSVLALAHTVRIIEFGSKIKVKYILWPAKAYEYKKIIEVKLPNIEIDSQPPLKVNNFINLDELQLEFKNLEFMGVIQRGLVKEMRFDETKFTPRPKLGNIIWTSLTAIFLGTELFEISKEVNVLWVIIIGIYFLSEIFIRLFRKRNDE
jgi:hypothetical protein